MMVRLGTIAPLASNAITFLSNAVGSSPAGTRHFLRLVNIILEFCGKSTEKTLPNRFISYFCRLFQHKKVNKQSISIKYNNMEEKKRLFEEFPPVTTEEWEAVIEKDLKGADYNKKLVLIIMIMKKK
jgi:hypothetical protein